MRKHFIYLLFAAVLTLAPVAALAAECTRMNTLFPKGEIEKTESGDFKWAGENMSDREYAEYLESKGSPAWPCMTAPLYFKGKEYPQDYKKPPRFSSTTISDSARRVSSTWAPCSNTDSGW